LAGYILRWYTRPKTITHPSTNRAQRRATSFMRRTMLPLRQTANRASYSVHVDTQCEMCFTVPVVRSFDGRRETSVCWCCCVQAASERVETCERLVSECRRSSEPLKSACSASSFVRVSKQLAELNSTLDDLRLSADNNSAQHDLQTYHVDNYDNILQVHLLHDTDVASSWGNRGGRLWERTALPRGIFVEI